MKRIILFLLLFLITQVLSVKVYAAECPSIVTGLERGCENDASCSNGWVCSLIDIDSCRCTAPPPPFPEPGTGCNICTPVCGTGTVCQYDTGGNCSCHSIGGGAPPAPGTGCNTCTPVCTSGNQCIYGSGGVCSCVPTGGGNGGTGGTTGTNPFGEVKNPLPYGGNVVGGGLIILLNNLLRLIFVVAGIFALIKILIAGLKFINAGGDAKAIQSAWESIWQSLLGVVIIISAFALAALVGQLLFGDPTFILNPKIYGPN